MRAYWFLVRSYWLTTAGFFLLAVLLFGFLRVNFVAAWVVILLLSIPGSIVMYLGGKKRCNEFSPAATENVMLSERQVSGGSQRNALLAMTPVSRGLSVDATTESVFVRPSGLMAGSADLLDLVHRFKFVDLVECRRMGQKVRLKYVNERNGVLLLTFANPDAFLQLVRQANRMLPV